MKLDFARNARRNMLASAVNNGVKTVIPFVNRTLFLWLLGPAYLGLNGLFGSVLEASGMMPTERCSPSSASAPRS